MTLRSSPDAGLVASRGAYTAGLTMPAHADRRSRLSIVLAGQLHERAGRTDEYAAPGSFALKPGDVVHRNVFGPRGAQTLSIELPDWLDREGPGAAIGEWRWFHGGPLALLAIRVWLAARAPTPDGSATDRLIDLLAAAQDLAGSCERGAVPPWLSRVREQLRDETAIGGARLSRLAAEAGVHPVYLARMFRRCFGCSVTEYAQAFRLVTTLARMTTTAEPMARIAAAAGYADQSHFSRACRRGLGITPAEGRRVLAVADARG